MENRPHYIPRVAGASAAAPQLPSVSGSGGGTFRMLAKYCWLSIPLSIVVNLALSGVKAAPSKEASLVVAVILGLVWLSGILAGVIALFGIRRHGRKGIMVPAIVGLSLWAVMLALAALAIPSFKKIQERAIALKARADASEVPTSSTSEPASVPASAPASSSGLESNSTKSEPVPTTDSPSQTQTPPAYPDGSTRVEDKDGRFSFAIPEGYSVASDKGPNDRHAFRRKLMTEPTRGIVIRDFGGNFSTRLASAKDFPAPPAGYTVTSLTFDWRGRAVGGTRSLDPMLAKPFVVFSVIIPLSNQSLLLEVGGSAESEAVIREVVDQVLASLTEEAN